MSCSHAHARAHAHAWVCIVSCTHGEDTPHGKRGLRRLVLAWVSVLTRACACMGKQEQEALVGFIRSYIERKITPEVCATLPLCVCVLDKHRVVNYLCACVRLCV